MKPAARLSVSDWAESYMMLPSDSAEPGRFKVSRTPYMREVMDAFTDPAINRIVVKSSAQVGKSTALLNIIGRTVSLEPCNIMIIQPTLEMAQDFSKDRLSKMIRDSRTLTPLFYEKEKTRDANQTILSKFYRGGRIILVGANSPAGLASRPIKILLCDEVDRYPPTTKEGDPIDIATKRTSSYFDRKVALFSTPTREGSSRIDIEYMLGTQEEWRHACPNCGEYHRLLPEDMAATYEEKRDDFGNASVVVQSVRWRCPDCACEFSEVELKNAPQKYIALNPAALKNGVRSFWVNGFSSAWLSWREIMREWLEAQGNPNREAVVMNTRFGLSYRYEKRVVDEQELLKRLESYGGEVPNSAQILTCGVDVQANRLHYLIMGYGLNESWGIKYGVIWGKPTQSGTWRALDEVLNRVYYRGRDGLKIARTFIDSGFATDNVYDYCRGRANVYPIKGVGSVGTPLLHKYSPQQDKGVLLIILGVNDGKAQVFSQMERTHYGRDDALQRNFDAVFFKELTAERAVLRKVGGTLVEVYETIGRRARNEALDVTVYALAAKQSLVGQDEAQYYRQLAGEIKKPPARKIKQHVLDVYS